MNKRFPDKFEVRGLDKYGEPFVSIEDSLEMADYVAERINRRGGNVFITRLIFNGPAANWLPETNGETEVP